MRRYRTYKGTLTWVNPKLENFTIPPHVTTIGYRAFGGCTLLKEIVVPDTVTEIDCYAFLSCINLTSVSLPKNLKVLSVGLFSHCEKLENVIIPDSVVKIERSVFNHCHQLKEITIPASVREIGYTIFYGCDNLERISVAAENPHFHSAGNCIIETETKTLKCGCKASVIPNDGSVTNIGENAFEGCLKLKSIVIPDSVENIGYNAFADCIELEQVTLSNRLHYIRSRAFACCKKLKNLVIPKSVDYIGCNAFIFSALVKRGKFKATNEYLACRDTQYTVGEWSAPIKNPVLCERGYHYCTNAFDLFIYYFGGFGQQLRTFEVEVKGDHGSSVTDSKHVCESIKLVKEFGSFAELLNN